MATDRHKLGSLEIGRFVAASMVTLGHVASMLLPYATHPGLLTQIGRFAPGSVAVEFFFVLSGFVMLTAHGEDFGRLGAVPQFWWRRACRIFPMYWVALVVPCYLLYPLLTPLSAVRLVSLVPVKIVEFVPTAWSLRYEVAFYIVFGLCLLPYLGRALLALWIGAVFLVWLPKLWQSGAIPPMAGAELNANVFGLFLSYFEIYFFAGLAAAWLFKAAPVLRPAFWAAVLGLGLVLLFAYILPATDWGTTHTSLMTFPASGAFAAVILGLARLERTGVIRCGRVARRLGAVSYPLYILHLPIMLLFSAFAVGMRLNTPAMLAIILLSMLVIYGVSAGFAFLVDLPLQRVVRGALRRRPQANASVTATGTWSDG